MTEDIKTYIISNIERGLDIAIIRQNLLSQGHSDYDIDKSINEISNKKFKKVENEPEEELNLE